MAGNGEDIQANLDSYKEQYRQVEAALTSDPNNEQLQKLKTDLQEVIVLTEELITPIASDADAPAAPGTSTQSSSKPVTRRWKTGDKCMAPWSKDQQLHPCKVDEILADGTCSVLFEGYDQSEVTQVENLRPYDAVRAKETLNKRDKAAAEREYKRAKNLKKKQRLKQLDEEREGEKNKWKNFNSKVFSKTTKGKVKKSIFATSDHVQGKVGVGTCGISGKPMTSFSSTPKYQKKS